MLDLETVAGTDEDVPYETSTAVMVDESVHNAMSNQATTGAGSIVIQSASPFTTGPPSEDRPSASPGTSLHNEEHNSLRSMIIRARTDKWAENLRRWEDQPRRARV